MNRPRRLSPAHSGTKTHGKVTVGNDDCSHCAVVPSAATRWNALVLYSGRPR